MTTKPIPKIHEVGYVLFDYYTGELLDKGSLCQVLSTMAYDMAITNRAYQDFELREVVVDEVRALPRFEVEQSMKKCIELGKIQ